MVRSKSETRVICDAGPIIHLDEVGCLDVMGDFVEIVIPDCVRQEVMMHRTISFESTGLPFRVAPPVPAIDKSLQTMCKIYSLDAGEVAALNILNRDPGLVFLTDDAAARLVATKLGFKVHGTIGVLTRAIRRDLMKAEEVINVLNLLPKVSTLYLKASLLEEIISCIKNEFVL